MYCVYLYIYIPFHFRAPIKFQSSEGLAGEMESRLVWPWTLAQCRREWLPDVCVGELGGSARLFTTGTILMKPQIFQDFSRQFLVVLSCFIMFNLLSQALKIHSDSTRWLVMTDSHFTWGWPAGVRCVDCVSELLQPTLGGDRKGKIRIWVNLVIYRFAQLILQHTIFIEKKQGGVILLNWSSFFICSTSWSP